MAERVVVGMSGGVDSSIAAALLTEQGFEVIGATILVWSPPGVEMGYTDSCCGLSAAEDARRVCARLGIRHYTLDFRELFYEKIVRDYVDEYRAGRTPNPCVNCNEFIKFRALLDRASDLGARRVATGHYARVRWDEERGRWLLLRGTELKKDQSYALYRLSQEQLSRSLFPLGELEKSDVRKQAAAMELPTAGKPDSQETCFVPNNDYPALIRLLDPTAPRTGEIRDGAGGVLGTHGGAEAFTIGQRRRINVGSPVPLYVSSIDAGSGAVTVVPRDDPRLYSSEVTARSINLIAITADELNAVGAMAVSARIRYNGANQPAVLTLERRNGEPLLRARFEQPLRAVTPGQSLVCYRGDEVIGGGRIAG